MSVGHCGLICVAYLFSGQNCFRRRCSTCHRVQPIKQKRLRKLIRYVGFVPKSNVPFTRPGPPPAPHPPPSQLQLGRPPSAVSLSLSLFLSHDSPLRAHTVVHVLAPQFFVQAVQHIVGRLVPLLLPCMPRIEPCAIFTGTHRSATEICALSCTSKRKVPSASRSTPRSRPCSQVRPAVGQGAQEAGAPDRVAEDHEGRRQANPHMLPGGP